jgi:hypothetical protein
MFIMFIITYRKLKSKLTIKYNAVTLPKKQQTTHQMSGNIVNFKAAANTNDGTPQVSILASASAKRMQERRRQYRLFKSTKGMGVGKKYPGVGTHHRNTKHVWLFSELAEVSAAYKEHHKTMPCWKIADMLHYSFSEQLKHNHQRQANVAQQAIDDDDQPICQLQEPRTHLPSIQAIQAKLLDCITLEYKETLGYASQPTHMHKQVWEHLELAEKHRAMLKKMTALPVPPTQIKEEQEQEQDMKLNHLAPVWNVHPTSFYIPNAEIEAAEPPTKRRKVVFEDEEVPQQQQQPQIKQEQEQEQPASKADFDAGIAELVSLMGEADDARRQERALIQRLVSQIREHNDQIGSHVSNIKDSHAEIEQCRQAIAHKMMQIETIILPVPLPTPAAAPATPPAMVCSKCTRTIEGGLGGFSVSYADPSHPDNETIECYECTPLSPASRKFLEQKEAEYSETERAIEHHLKHEKSCCYSSDDDMYMNDGYYPGFGGGYYDHAEECS